MGDSRETDNTATSMSLACVKLQTMPMKCFIQHPSRSCWPCNTACLTRDAQKIPSLAPDVERRGSTCQFLTDHRVCWKSPRKMHAGKRANIGVTLEVPFQSNTAPFSSPFRFWQFRKHQREKLDFFNEFILKTDQKPLPSCSHKI